MVEIYTDRIEISKPGQPGVQLERFIDSVRTTCVLHGARAFAEMSRDDQLRASYQHCCLRYVSNEPMTNRSLRERFGLAEEQAALASQVIAATQATGQIKLDGTAARSKRYARYVSHWA